jgi:hypothetical protein
MKTITNFIQKYGIFVILGLFTLSTCTNSMSKRQSEKRVKNEIDSVRIEISKLKDELKKEIKIEGLKGEKRMIQSTDRKIMDLNRQIEIDKELKALDK